MPLLRRASRGRAIISRLTRAERYTAVKRQRIEISSISIGRRRPAPRASRAQGLRSPTRQVYAAGAPRPLPGARADCLHANARRATATRPSTASTAGATSPPIFSFTAASTSPSAGSKSNERAGQPADLPCRVLPASRRSGRRAVPSAPRLRSLLPQRPPKRWCGRWRRCHRRGDRPHTTARNGSCPSARKVAVTPDRVVITPDGVRVQRIRTGRKTKSEPDKPIYALLRRGAAGRYPGKTSQHRDLLSRDRRGRAGAAEERRQASPSSTPTLSTTSRAATFTPMPDAGAARTASATSCAEPEPRALPHFPRSLRFLLSGPIAGPRRTPCPRPLSSFRPTAGPEFSKPSSPRRPRSGELHDALEAAGIPVDAETFIFIDEADEHLQGQRHEPIRGLKHGTRVHVTRCQRIKTTVHFLDKTAEHANSRPAPGCAPSRNGRRIPSS